MSSHQTTFNRYPMTYLWDGLGTRQAKFGQSSRLHAGYLCR